MRVKAPAVVKLLGEHAVVYGKLSLAAAVGLYAYADISRDKPGVLRITEHGASAEFDRAKLNDLYESFSRRKSIADYIRKNAGMELVMLCYATIAARLMNEFKIDVLGKRVSMSSEIVAQKGYASSAARFTAFTRALLKYERARLDDSKFIDTVRDGERVAHRNENAGGMDVSTSYYGGYVSFSSKGGAKKEKISTRLKVLLIDTGPKKSTSETVAHVSRLYKRNRERVGRTMEQINECAREGITALRAGDVKRLGALMFKDQELLKSLGVSSKGLDKAVEVAKKAGAYGAKLSGGGGGGLAIAISGNLKKTADALKASGFDVSVSGIARQGAGA